MVALFVIATFLTFIGIDYLLQRAAKRKAAVAAAPARPTSMEKFLLPRSYFFSRGHAWVQLLFSGKARVGIDDFVQKIVGRIDRISALPVGMTVKKGDPLITVHQNGRTLTFPAPLSGKIVEVNPALKRLPELAHKDPYIAGWVAVIEPENIASEIKVLAVADDAARWLRKEVARFRDFIQTKTPQLALAHTGRTLLDGGMPMGGVLENADAKVWTEFESSFLRGSDTQPQPLVM